MTFTEFVSQNHPDPDSLYSGEYWEIYDKLAKVADQYAAWQDQQWQAKIQELVDKWENKKHESPTTAIEHMHNILIQQLSNDIDNLIGQGIAVEKPLIKN